jgi:hypothetical protein
LSGSFMLKYGDRTIEFGEMAFPSINSKLWNWRRISIPGSGRLRSLYGSILENFSWDLNVLEAVIWGEWATAWMPPRRLLLANWELSVSKSSGTLHTPSLL